MPVDPWSLPEPRQNTTSYTSETAVPHPGISINPSKEALNDLISQEIGLIKKSNIGESIFPEEKISPERKMLKQLASKEYKDDLTDEEVVNKLEELLRIDCGSQLIDNSSFEQAALEYMNALSTELRNTRNAKPLLTAKAKLKAKAAREARQKPKMIQGALKQKKAFQVRITKKLPIPVRKMAARTTRTATQFTYLPMNGSEIHIAPTLRQFRANSCSSLLGDLVENWVSRGLQPSTMGSTLSDHESAVDMSLRSDAISIMRARQFLPGKSLPAESRNAIYAALKSKRENAL